MKELEVAPDTNYGLNCEQRGDIKSGGEVMWKYNVAGEWMASFCVPPSTLRQYSRLQEWDDSNLYSAYL